MVNSLKNQQHLVEDQPPPAKKMKMQLTSIPKEVRDDLQFNLIDVKLCQKNVLDKQDFIFLNSYATNEEKIEMLMELLRNKTEDHHNDFLEIMEEDYKWLRDKCEIFFQRVRLDALKNGGSKPCPVPQGDLIIDCQDRNSTEESDRSIIVMKSPSSTDSTAITQRLNGNIVKKEKEDKTFVSAPAKELKKPSQSLTAEMMTIVRRNHRVVRHWSTLAHVLGMSKITHTLRMRMVINGEDSDSCVLHLLEEWKGAHPKEATLEKLLSVLREEDFNDVADELEEKFAS